MNDATKTRIEAALNPDTGVHYQDGFWDGVDATYLLAKAEGRREMLREVLDALDGNDWWTIEESLRERFPADLDETEGA